MNPTQHQASSRWGAPHVFYRTRATLTLVLFAAWLAPSVSLADPIASGKTVIKLAQRFEGQLRSNEIAVQAIKRRPAKPRTLTLPILGGSLRPVTMTAASTVGATSAIGQR